MARILLSLWFLAVWTSPSWAYLDPGTGSMLLQGIAASLAVAAGAVSMSWQRVKHLALRLLGRDRDTKIDPEG